jgi:hypothetical protein
MELLNLKNKIEDIATGKEAQKAGHHEPFPLGGFRKNFLHIQTHDEGGKHEKGAGQHEEYGKVMD